MRGCAQAADVAADEVRQSVNEFAQDGRDRALPRQAGLQRVPQVAQRAGAARRQDATLVRAAVRLHRAGDQADGRSRHSPQALSDQDSRHRRCERGTAHRRRADRDRRRPTSRRARRRDARAGLRHEGHVGVGGFQQHRQAGRIRAGRPYVGAAHASARGHPQQPGSAAVLQGHAHAARTSRAGVPPPDRGDDPIAALLLRSAGGAQAAAGRAHLRPQPASGARGHRRGGAARAPCRAARRARAHAHGAADLRRSVGQRDA